MLPLWTIVTDGFLLSSAYLMAAPHQPFGALFAHGFDTERGRLGETDFLHAHLVLQKFQHFLSLWGAVHVLDASVDVFGILTENDHVGQLRVLHRRGYPGVVAHWPHTGVQVQLLAQGHVQAANAAAYGRGQGAFDAHEVLAESVQRFGWQPVVHLLVGFFTGQHFLPHQLFFAAVCLLHRRIEHKFGGVPDIRSDAVALNEGNDGLVGHIELAVFDGDFLVCHLKIIVLLLKCWIVKSLDCWNTGLGRAVRVGIWAAASQFPTRKQCNNRTINFNTQKFLLA